MERYKHWDIIDEIPEGWKIDTTAGSPCPRTVFVTNGKSVLNGQKRALLRVGSNNPVLDSINEVQKTHPANGTTAQRNEPFPTKTVNILARKKFQEQLLKEIKFDLAVCEIEGWDKMEYIEEIKRLIDSIYSTK